MGRQPVSRRQPATRDPAAAEKRDLQLASTDALAKIDALKSDVQQRQAMLQAEGLVRRLTDQEVITMSELSIAEASYAVASADLRIGAAARLATTDAAKRLSDNLKSARKRLKSDLDNLNALAEKLQQIQETINKIGIAVEKALALAAKLAV